MKSLEGKFQIDYITRILLCKENYHFDIRGTNRFLDFSLPPGADSFILGINKGQGIVPIGLYLTQQVRVEKINKLREEYGQDIIIYVIPIRSHEYIHFPASIVECDSE